MEDGRLLDLGNYPEIHADGLGEVHFYAGNAHFMLFGWRRIEGVWRKIVVGMVSRPEASLRPAQMAGLQTIFRDGAPMH